MTTTMMPQVIAHRGASANAPENTLAAIRLAAQNGASWIEIDINISLDGIPVLHHDDGLERCSNGTGLVIEHNISSLLALDSGSWFSDEFRGEPIATLEQCLNLADELSLSINLEIKPCSGWEVPTTQRIADVLKNRSSLPPILLSSFSPQALQCAFELLPEIPRSSLYLVAPPDWQAATRQIGASNIHLHANSLLTANMIEQFHEAGLGVYCYTVNTANEACALLELGVDGVFSNYPADLLASLPKIKI